MKSDKKLIAALRREAKNQKTALARIESASSADEHVFISVFTQKLVRLGGAHACESMALSIEFDLKKEELKNGRCSERSR